MNSAPIPAGPSTLAGLWTLKGLYGFKDAEQASAQLDRLDKRDQGRWTGVMKPMGRALEMVQKYEVEILN